MLAQLVARLPQVLPHPPVRALAVGAMVDGAPQVVGGVQIGPTGGWVARVVDEGGDAKRKRGKDKQGVTRLRTCKRCKAWGDAMQGQTCIGRTKKGSTSCEFHDRDPEDEDFDDGVGEDWEEGEEG